MKKTSETATPRAPDGAKNHDFIFRQLYCKTSDKSSILLLWKLEVSNCGCCCHLHHLQCQNSSVLSQHQDQQQRRSFGKNILPRLSVSVHFYHINSFQVNLHDDDVSAQDNSSYVNLLSHTNVLSTHVVK